MRFTSILLLVALVANADAERRRGLGYTSDAVICADRAQNDCEQDDLCMKVQGSCRAANQGVGVTGSACIATFEDSPGNNADLITAEVQGYGCANGFGCVVTDTSVTTTGVNMTGTCQPTKCFGKKVPGNCNGGNNDQCSQATVRVTICHRTCSETNPWVRITIDDDAWDDGKNTECGHQQHTIDPTCNGKNLTKWGIHRSDYLLKRHGTRADIAAKVPDDKAYWRIWERACPYVVSEKCCEWGSTDNPCCGEPPEEVSPPTSPEPEPQAPVEVVQPVVLTNPEPEPQAPVVVVQPVPEGPTNPEPESQAPIVVVQPVPEVPTNPEPESQPPVEVVQPVPEGSTDPEPEPQEPIVVTQPGPQWPTKPEPEPQVLIEAEPEPQKPEPFLEEPHSTCHPTLFGVNGVIQEESESSGSYTSESQYPIKIISGNNVTVTFEVCGPTVGKIYASFTEIDGGYLCHATNSHSGCVQYTAACMSGHHRQSPMALVDVHVTAPFADEANTPVPKCCHDDDEHALSAFYLFELRCDCPMISLG